LQGLHNPSQRQILDLFIQGSLSIYDCYRKMKMKTNALSDIDELLVEHNLVLNILQGLNKKYDHL
jgi:hypothetical protein